MNIRGAIARTGIKGTRAPLLASLAVAGAVLAGVAASLAAAGVAGPAASSWSVDAPRTMDSRQQEGTGNPAPRPPAAALGPADGVVPDGVTVFDDQVPAVSHLDPALLDALRRAATDAAREDHLEFRVNSGWRSAAYQERLLLDAVARYGSRRKAARWVATPRTSAHVSGDAVDLELPAARWLSANGSRYGLCQIYRNETWHYELRPGAIDRGCPAMYADPTRDPRMQR